jgi:hypothetical protein
VDGPKKSDYKPTEGEKMNAAVAVAEQKRFKEIYDPLLQQMRDESLTQNFSEIARGKANADTMQALTGEPMQYRNTQNVGRAGDLGAGLGGQLQQANVQAKKAQNQTQSGVLATARQQQDTTAQALNNIGKIESSAALAKAKANQEVATAKFNAGAQLAGAYVLQGLENKATKGKDGSTGTWHTPVRSDGTKISSVKDRYLDYFG